MTEHTEMMNTQPASKPYTLWAGGGAFVVCLAAAGWMAFGGQNAKADKLNPSTATQSTGPSAELTVAKVDGQTVSELEIANLLGAGVDRAIALDRYINKVIAAERGRKMYEKESTALTRAAEREVLATLYTSRRLEELRKAVSAEDVKAFYAKNVLDENFKTWKVSYYLTTEGKDMEQTLQKMKEGDRDALKQLKPLAEQGDQFLMAAAMPYNLGRVVSKMKKGEFSEVLRLRNGLLVVRVDDFKQQDKPKLDNLKDEITEAIAQQRFNEELEQARRKAKVELG